MKTWLIGGTAVALAAGGIYFATAKKSDPATPQAVAPAAVAAVTPATAPRPEVVDVLDLAPLLDPPAEIVPPADTVPVLTVFDDRPELLLPRPSNAPSAPAVLPPAGE